MCEQPEGRLKSNYSNQLLKVVSKLGTAFLAACEQNVVFVPFTSPVEAKVDKYNFSVQPKPLHNIIYNVNYTNGRRWLDASTAKFLPPLCLQPSLLTGAIHLYHS